ncbi:MAG TPA: choice-of-anchor Q domain-containing protein, partial [Ktedonobacteraceae bacterium]
TRAFTAARLLTTNTASGIATVEVSHEAVIREWTRLTGWLDEAREDVHLQRAISEDVAAWEQSGRSRDRLYRGSQLKEARAWVKRNIPSANEVAFLHTSVVSRVRFFVSMIALLLILVSSMGGAIWVLTHQPPDPTFVSNLLDNDKPGSLRHAIDAAASRSTIMISASLHGTILLTVGDLNIAKDLSIRGPGEGILSISSGTSAHSIRVVQGVTVTIFGLTFKDSKNSTSATGFIDNQGTLILNNSTISGNTASSSGGTINQGISGGGGGISNEGTLTLNNSTISGNSAFGGGGIFNSGTLTLNNSTVSANTASTGGGIFNGGTLTLNNSTISANTASDGGGFYIVGSSGVISTTTTNTTIINNSTISDNNASDMGGGILFESSIGSNNLSSLIQANLTFSTIYDNTAQSGGDIAIRDANCSSNDTNCKLSKQVSQVKIRNSIVAGDPTHLDSDIVGMLTSYGYNLFQDNSGATFDPASRKQHGTDKIVSVNDLTRLFADPSGLQDNGGPTRTYALAPGSPAFDQIPLADCLVNGITTDQRGVKRPDGNETTCDIGAFESSS